VAAPTIDGVYRWMVDFLTANFQREPSSSSSADYTYSCLNTLC
jgi:hypothetical protein